MLENIIRTVKKLGEKSFGLSLLIFIGILVISLARNVTQIKQTASLIQAEEFKVKHLREEQTEVQKKLEKVQSEEFVEKQLRDTLGMSKEGDIVIVLPDEEIVRKFAPKPDKEKEDLPDPNWKKWLKLFL